MIDLYSYIFRIYEDKLYFFSPVDCLKEKKEDGRGVDVKTFRLLYLFPTIGNVAFGDTFCCNLDIYGKYSRLGYKTSQNSVKKLKLKPKEFNCFTRSPLQNPLVMVNYKTITLKVFVRKRCPLKPDKLLF